MISATISTSLYINGSLIPNDWLKRTALRNKLLNTYPLPSLAGNAPSAIAKEIVLMWSAITLNATSCASSIKYFFPETCSTSLIIGINKSVS